MNARTATERPAPTQPEEAVEFRHGIPGFEYLTRFTITSLEDHPPFQLLRSVEEPDVAMLILELKHIKTATIHIPETELEKLKIERRDDPRLKIYAILKFDRTSQWFTANEKAPVVVNEVERLGEQIILEDEELSFNRPVMLADG